MNYVTIDTVTDVLGADWATSGDGNTAVLLANAWLNEKRLTLYDDVVPDSILHAGAYIAKEVIAGNMYQGRKDGIVVSKSVKAGPVTSSKTYASGVDGQPDRHVVAQRREHRRRVEELVVPERGGPRVGPARAVEHPADAVEHPAHDQQHQGRHPGARQQVGQHEHRHPAQGQVQRHPHPARRPRPQQLQRHPGQRARPHHGQHPVPGGLGHGQQREGGVRTGDEQEDHRVVGPLHPRPGPHRVPGAAVVERAHPEHRGDGGAVDGRPHGRAHRDRARGQRHQHRAAHQRGGERPQVDPAARPGLGQGGGGVQRRHAGAPRSLCWPMTRRYRRGRPPEPRA